MSTPSFGAGPSSSDGVGEQGSVGELAGQAQEQAQALAGQARSKAREQVDQRSSDVGQRVNGTAEDLRGVAEHLRSQGKDQPARVAEEAAARLTSAGSYLQQADGERMLHDIERLGRERPWAAVAGGVALGFVASRFLKASSTERYRGSGSVGASSSGGYRSARVGRVASFAPVGGEGERDG